MFFIVTTVRAPFKVWENIMIYKHMILDILYSTQSFDMYVRSLLN